MLKAWEVTSWDQFQERLREIVAVDADASWYNAERVRMFHESRNRFRFNLMRESSPSSALFRDGLFLVHSREGIRPGTVQMESYEWVLQKGASIEQISRREVRIVEQEPLYRFKKDKFTGNILSFPYEPSRGFHETFFADAEQLSDALFVILPQSLRRGNWMLDIQTPYPGHQLYIINKENAAASEKNTIYLLPEKDMKLYTAPEAKDKKTETELPIF